MIALVGGHYNDPILKVADEVLKRLYYIHLLYLVIRKLRQSDSALNNVFYCSSKRVIVSWVLSNSSFIYRNGGIRKQRSFVMVGILVCTLKMKKPRQGFMKWLHFPSVEFFLFELMLGDLTLTLLFTQDNVNTTQCVSK